MIQSSRGSSTRRTFCAAPFRASVASGRSPARRETFELESPVGDGARTNSKLRRDHFNEPLRTPPTVRSTTIYFVPFSLCVFAILSVLCATQLEKKNVRAKQRHLHTCRRYHAAAPGADPSDRSPRGRTARMRRGGHEGPPTLTHSQKAQFATGNRRTRRPVEWGITVAPQRSCGRDFLTG